MTAKKEIRKKLGIIIVGAQVVCCNLLLIKIQGMASYARFKIKKKRKRRKGYS